MNRARFETLAQAYGGEVARWPVNDREPAAALMAANPGWAAGVLADALALDAVLDADPPPRVSGALVEAIVAAAPAARRLRWVGWLLPAGMGAGLAAACAAGVLAGLQLAPTPTFDAESTLTAIGDEDFSLDLDEEG